MIYDIDSEGEGYEAKHFKNQTKNTQQQQQKDKDKDNIDLNKEEGQQQSQSQQKIVQEKDFKLLSTKNIIGKVSFMRWRRQKNFFFALDMQKGRILCYKTQDSKKPTTYYTIVKGQIIEDEETQNDNYLMRVKSKKGKTFTLQINQDKEPKTIENYINSCISQQREEEEESGKGFFFMLGKGVMSIFKIPYRVTSGILVSENLPKKTNQIVTPNTIFNEQKKKAKENFIPVSGMFFGTSPIVKEIVGSIAVLHGQYQETSSMFSLSQEIMTGDSQCAVGLIFKPVLGTIDMVIMKMRNGDLSMERQLYDNIFKVRRVSTKKSKKKKKKQIQAEKDRQYLESQMGIDDTKMEQVSQKESEILYLKKNNGILHKTDIDKMHKWGQVINLGDVDQTKKREEDYQMEQEITNEILDFYKKQIENQEEETCEFMVIYPTPQEKIEEDDMNLEYEDTMEENFGEDTVVNMERYSERYEQKCLPRVTQNLVGSEHNKNVLIVKEGSMPSFQVQKSPFSKLRGSDSEEEKNENTENQDVKKNIIQQFNDEPQQIKQEDQQDQEIEEVKVKNTEQQEAKSSTQNLEQNNLQVPKNEEKKVNSDQQLEEIEEDSDSSDEENNFGEGDDAIVKANCDYEHVRMKKSEILQWVQNYKHFESKGEERIPDAYKNGGKVCNNKEIISTMRGVGKLILGQIGRKILSGDFQLTTVSFPIKAMIPKSALFTIQYGTVLFPYYMNLAVKTNDLVERFRLLITASLGNFPVANGFLKPLNPILGETFQGSLPDGTKIYGEQTSHHPPVSSFLTIGPNKSYTFSGYYLYDAKAGFNSLTLKNKGKRKMVFNNDNQVIEYGYGYEQYSGTFMGTMKHETLGSMEFIDKKNNIKATIVIGKVKKKPTDFISGEITVNGNVVSRCYGSYNGFIEFDGIRYWDFKQVKPFRINVEESFLESDHTKRQDRIQLEKGHINKAQKEKENLELLQRRDKKLRKAYQEEQQKLNKQAEKEQKKAEKLAKKNKQ